MNVKLLRKVAKHILAEPKRLYMSSYIVRKEKMEIDRPYPKCGTAACIAGWTCLLTPQLKNFALNENYDAHGPAEKILGLSRMEANRLFLPGHWPEKFVGGISDDGKKKTAEVAVARIEWFIKTKGRE